MEGVFLTIGGSDSSAAAGIQTDIKVAKDIGIYAISVVSCITAQNATKILGVELVSAEIFKMQIDALLAEFDIKVIKTSVLSSIDQIDIIVDLLDSLSNVTYICDPVILSTSGCKLLSDDLLEYAKQKLYPKADILIPNLDEAKALIDDNMEYDEESFGKLASRIQQKYGCKGILLKGGHVGNKYKSQDYFYSSCSSFALEGIRYLYDKKIRGTGCTLSSAIASFLALGFDVNNSIVLAKSYITRAIQKSQNMTGSMNFISETSLINTTKDFPKIYLSKNRNLNFKKMERIGFYPIVDCADKIPKLAKLGIKTIQLRIKAKSLEYVEQQVKQAVEYQNKYSLQLFINDYHELAIKYKAYGIHLGHEDLIKLLQNNEYILIEIQKRNIALGLSTHDYYELSVALSVKPSYIALGPIYETTTKKMKFKPQGLAKVLEWLNILDLPLVAIGGIKKAHIESISKLGVDGISVVSLIDQLSDVEIMEITKFLRF